MNTLIESINKVTKIKSELNKILQDNGLDGGEVFTDYPDKFRELFRVSGEITESISEGYTPASVNVITEVPDPVLEYDQNIVYITCQLKDAGIYYWIKTDSGNNEVGTTLLMKGNSVVMSESGTLFCYAQYRDQKSNTVSIYCPVQEVVVPDPPMITREGTTVTIEKFGETDEIYYNIGNGYVLYTEAITVERYVDVYAFTQNYRGRSNTIINEAPEKPVAPEVPVISYTPNTITITCSTTGATIYYKKVSDKYWTEYSNPITITESAYYVTKSIKSGLQSASSDAVYCEYVGVPVEPSIVVSNNYVYLSTLTTGASIYYKIGSGEYQLYSSPIKLTETVTVTAYTDKSGITSNTVSQTCTYVEPVTPTVPDNPVITFSSNIVTITCATAGATIYYWTSINGIPNIYSGQFAVTETVTVYSYSSKDGLNSSVVSQECVYVPPVEPTAPNLPVFSCSNNYVTITCSTVGAVIYYRNINDSSFSIYGSSFPITETTSYIAYSVKDDVASEQTEVFTATYVPVERPADPVISCSENVVTITCSTSGAIIYYSINNSGSWFVYRNPVNISSTVTISAYSMKNDVESLNRVSLQCIYVTPIAINYLTLNIVHGGYIWLYSVHPSPSSTSGAMQSFLYYYSINNGPWTLERSNDGADYGGTTYKISVSAGDKVRFKSYRFSDGTTYQSQNESCWYRFGNSYATTFNVEGNPMSLIDDSWGWENLPFRINGLFKSCTGVLSCEDMELPYTILCENCYEYMFNGCTNLTTPPELPATTLADSCYSNMFYGCTSLTTAPFLPATEPVHYCYSNMFAYCTSLNYCECLLHYLNDYCTYNWLDHVSSTGILLRSRLYTGTSWPTGISGRPSGWTEMISPYHND